MFKKPIFICLLLIQIIQSQNVNDQSINTDVKTCSCNLNQGLCDVSCCCDVDCSSEQIKSFNCSDLGKNEDVNWTSSKVNYETRCFENLPIYASNGPYNVKQKGNLVCINGQKNTDADISYQTQINQKLDSFTFARSINFDAGASSPLGTPSELTTYRLGTSIFRYISSSNTTSYYALPVKLFNSQWCSGFQPITFMNDFSSTCTQPINEQTCNDALNAEKYNTQFCLIKNPSNLADGNTNYTCCNGNGTNATWSASVGCSNALKSVSLKIFYTNPNGIDSCTVDLIVPPGPSTSSYQQTFDVQFIRTSSVTPSSSARSGNPGYLVRAPIIFGTLNGGTISTSSFTVLRPSATGDCTGTPRIPIRFGENIQSTCQYGSNDNCLTPADLAIIFLSNVTSNIRVAARANPDPNNVATDWLPVRHCIYDIGSSNDPDCSTNSVPSPSANECYIRMDIQIAYANIGSVGNPQPILGSVVFYYQRINKTSTVTLSTPFLITQTVTYQDISTTPVTEGDHLPNPNVRLPGDFFYPLTLNRATNSISFSLYLYLLIMCAFILM